jgi:hypothetical protein
MLFTIFHKLLISTPNTKNLPFRKSEKERHGKLPTSFLILILLEQFLKIQLIPLM